LLGRKEKSRRIPRYLDAENGVAEMEKSGL
jgi:hypothetical protein